MTSPKEYNKVWTADAERQLLIEILTRREITLPVDVIMEAWPEVGTFWTIERERKSLDRIFKRMNITTVHVSIFQAIATKWGGEYTENALRKKLSSMKVAYERDPTDGGDSENGASKRKASDNKNNGGDGNEAAGKAKKVKEKEDNPVIGPGNEK